MNKLRTPNQMHMEGAVLEKAALQWQPELGHS